MNSKEPQVQKHLATENCTPLKAGTYCALSPICQRCQRCIGHCVCPPIEMRFKPKSGGRR
jgi:hypothetical protein